MDIPISFPKDKHHTLKKVFLQLLLVYIIRTTMWNKQSRIPYSHFMYVDIWGTDKLNGFHVNIISSVHYSNLYIERGTCSKYWANGRANTCPCKGRGQSQSQIWTGDASNYYPRNFPITSHCSFQVLDITRSCHSNPLWLYKLACKQCSLSHQELCHHKGRCRIERML